MKNEVVETLRAEEVSDLVINSLPGVFYLQAQDGHYIKWNKNFELSSGYSAEEIPLLNPLVFFEEKDHARMIAIIEKVFEEGAAEIEVDTITKSGKIVPFFLNGRAVNYEGQHCLIGMGIDITKRVNAEKEIKQKESHLNALFENMGGAIFLLDTNKRLVIFNNELVKYYKIFAGDAPRIGDPAYDFLSPERLKRKYDILDRVLAGEKQVLETDYERNGQRFFFRAGFNPIVVDDKITGISCYVIDVTSLKKAELASQKAQERLNYHINNSPLAVIEYDKDMKVTFWSKRARDIYGWSEEEVTGKRLADFLLYEEDVDKVTEGLRIHEMRQEKGPLANRNYSKDGRVLYTRWYNSFLTDEHGNIETIMSVIRDVTELWKAELQREEMADDLVKRNNELEQFTYIVSHNLRSPVASLLGLTEVLSEFELTDEERTDIVAGIAQSAQRLDDVIKDLNAILHLKNKQDDKKEAVLFSKVVNEIERGIDDYYGNDFVIETDFSSIDEHHTLKNYIVSIFNNLISNSIKYRRQGETPVIKIKSELYGSKLVLTFNDNGMGIDTTKNNNEIFGLYKRFHFHVEGKGLGLYMVKNQVESLGGKISVASVPGLGTEFRIEFDI